MAMPFKGVQSAMYQLFPVHVNWWLQVCCMYVRTRYTTCDVGFLQPLSPTMVCCVASVKVPVPLQWSVAAGAQDGAGNGRRVQSTK